MFPYFCQHTGTCPFFPMGFPPLYPMPYMMSYGYPPFFEEAEEEHEHEHKYHRDEEVSEEGLDENAEENIEEYRMAGPMGHQPAPGQFGPGPVVPGHFIDPAGILRYIETRQPDIFRTMVSRGIPPIEARRIIRRIIAITLRFCREGR